MAVQSLMSTKIAIDTLEASTSIKNLQSVVRAMSSEWQSQSKAQEIAGNTIGALETKFSGLGRAMEVQRAKIDALKQKQSEITDTTQKGAEAYLKYERQISTTEAQLARMTQEQTKAKQALDYQKSGLAALQREYKEQNQLSQSLVQRLTAEGKERSALKEQYRQSQKNIENLNAQYVKQTQELEKIQKASGEASNAFLTQQKRVNTTATSLANAKKNADSFNQELKQTDPSLFGRLRKKIAETNSELKETSKINSKAWDFVKGNLIANGISNIGSKLKDAATEGFELAKASDETKERLTALGYTKEQISILSHAMGDLKLNTALSGATAKSLTERFMSMTGSASKTQAIVKGFGVLANDLKLNDEQANNLSGSFTRIYSAGKLSAGVLARMEKSTPGVTSAFAKMAGTTTENFQKMVNDGKITSDKFNELLSDNSKRFLASGQEYKTSARGITDYLKKSWQGLEKSFATPIFETAKKSLGKLTQQFDPKIFDRLGTSLGKISAKGLEAVSNVFEYLLKNRKEIGGISSSVISIAKSFGEGVWDTAKTVINGISGGFNAIFRHSKSAQKPIKTLSDGMKELASHKEAIKTIGVIFASYFVGTKVVSGVSSLVRGLYKIPAAFNAIKLAMNTNPFGIALTAITTIGVALAVLYKKNKKFRGWVNKAAKGVANFFKPIAKFLGKIGKAIGGAISSVVKFNKKTGLISKTLKLAFAPLKLIGSLVVLPFKIALSAINGFRKRGLGGLIKGAGKALGVFGKFTGGVIKGAGKLASKAGKSIKSFASGIGKKLKGGTSKAGKVFKKFTGAISKGAKKLSKSSNKIFSSMGKKVSSIFSKMSKSAKKSHDKMAKDSSKGMQKTSKATIKQAQKMAKDVERQFDKLKKTSQKLFKTLPKDAKKVFKDVVKQVNKGNKDIGKKLKALDKSIRSFDKNYNNVFKALAKTTDKFTSKTKKDLKSIDKLVKDGTRWQKALEKNTEGLSKSIRKVMASIQKEWDKSWDFIADSSSRAFDRVYRDEQKVLVGQVNPSIKKTNNDILNNFRSTFDQVSKASGAFWGNLKKQAGSGFNGIIDVINQGVSGIDSLVGSFGGNRGAIGKISPVRYASGTGYFGNVRRPITAPTLAMLNDGNDSPETDNQETVILPSGEFIQPKGRNVTTFLPTGSEVLNATETRLLGLSRFASGTGLFSYLFDQAQSMSVPSFNSKTDDGKEKMADYINKASEESKENFSKLFNPVVNSFGGFFKEFQHAIAKPVDSEGHSWYKALFDMAKEKLGSISAKAGMIGDDYPGNLKAGAVWSSSDPWGYFVKECVSFVASRLNNLGVNPSLFSHLGNGNNWISARVPHVGAKPGTVAVYSHGGQNHVSWVTAVHDGMMDGEEYNWLNQHSYHQYTNRPLSQATAFLDFGVKLKTKEEESAEQDKNLSARQQLAKKQTDPMLKWIEDNLADTAGGGADNPGGTGVERWTPYVKKALKANGIDPTDFRVSKILATIRRESNGDPNVQNNWDSNAAAGHPSIGLMQTIGPTFDAYKHKGHGNIRNGYDNLLAAINYIKHRYGTDDAAFNRVAAYGYANGGLVSANGLYELAEGNRPEYVIPTDIAKRGRAKQLLNEVKERFARDTPSEETEERGNSSDDKLDKVISLLQNLLAVTVRGSQTTLNIDGKKIAEAIAPFSTEANSKFNTRQRLIKGF